MQSKAASISYIDESTYQLEHDKTIQEPTEEHPIREDSIEAVDDPEMNPGPLKSHRPPPVAKSEIKSEVEKSH